MLNQNQIQNADAPAIMNQYQTPGMAFQQTNPNQGMPQPQVPSRRLPYYANGWRKNARTCALLHQVLSTASLLISLVFVIIYFANGKKGAEGPLVLLVLFPIFEITAALVLLSGTTEEKAEQNPLGSMTRTVVWLVMAINIMLEKLGFSELYILFVIIDEGSVLFVWNALSLGCMIMLFGVVVPYAMAIYAVSRSAGSASGSEETEKSGILSLNPNLNAGPKAPHMPSKWHVAPVAGDDAKV